MSHHRVRCKCCRYNCAFCSDYGEATPQSVSVSIQDVLRGYDTLFYTADCVTGSCNGVGIRFTTAQEAIDGGTYELPLAKEAMTLPDIPDTEASFGPCVYFLGLGDTDTRSLLGDLQLSSGPFGTIYTGKVNLAITASRMLSGGNRLWVVEKALYVNLDNRWESSYRKYGDFSVFRGRSPTDQSLACNDATDPLSNEYDTEWTAHTDVTPVIGSGGTAALTPQ
jgi:hypothetical protein